MLCREEVVRLLVNDGDFLVRETTRNDEKQTVLSVMWGSPKHFIVQLSPEGLFRQAICLKSARQNGANPTTCRKDPQHVFSFKFRWLSVLFSGSKYIEFKSRSRILAQFGSGSRVIGTGTINFETKN